jgi:hypothetical protein
LPTPEDYPAHHPRTVTAVTHVPDITGMDRIG